ncbi:MAG: ATP/GTP-binding protein [Alphaproteobacteria bacterium]
MPNFFYFSANQTISSTENASRFSDLRQAGKAKSFTEFFCQEYPWISDLTIEASAGLPVIYAEQKRDKRLVPLPEVSGGINRIIGILLAIASNPGTIVLVDKIENGLYYKHYGALWRLLLSLCRENNSQLLLTTHNIEWLNHLLENTKKKHSDIALFRVSRGKDIPLIEKFHADSARNAILHGVEIR